MNKNEFCHILSVYNLIKDPISNIYNMSCHFLSVGIPNDLLILLYHHHIIYEGQVPI